MSSAFLGSPEVAHPEAAAARPYRGTRRSAMAAVAALALFACSCAAPRSPPAPPRMPNGSREALRPGYWQGMVKTTLVNFYIDRVVDSQVAIRINGGVLSPQRDSPSHPVAFTDRPKNCLKSIDGLSFDCLRYRSMHIDNGFLCGYYTLGHDIFQICFAPGALPRTRVQ